MSKGLGQISYPIRRQTKNLNEARMGQVVLAILVVAFILIGYWALNRSANQGMEERFRSAIGLDQAKEHDVEGALSVEGGNPRLYLFLFFITLAFGIAVYYVASRRRARWDDVSFGQD
jgi:uncharacterized BrkB/YihY/UPF0761 family membrane protein